MLAQPYSSSMISRTLSTFEHEHISACSLSTLQGRETWAYVIERSSSQDAYDDADVVKRITHERGIEIPR
jgi:hypothetical protein